MSKVYIETYGCALNQADSETMAGILHADGFLEADAPPDADLVIINTCTVKTRTFLNFIKRLRALRELGKPLLVAGCIPSVYSKAPFLQDVSYITVRDIESVAGVARKVLNGELVQVRGKTYNSSRLLYPVIRLNPVIEIIPLAQGCTGVCTYCQTRLARGALHSYPAEHILERIRRAVNDEGVKEIWLTAQDNGAYGLDRETNIIELLRKIRDVKGMFRVRIGMTNPEHTLSILEHLLDQYEDERMYNFLHLPLQSGSDNVLRAMKRKYQVRDYMKIVERIRTRFKEFTIATDIIAGFPGETDDDFAHTLDVLKEIQPAVVNRSHFSPRPWTPAEQMNQLPVTVINERSRRLSRLVEHLCEQDNERWLDWKGIVLVDMQKRPDSIISRNPAYKPIILPFTHERNRKMELGTFAEVKVVAKTTFHLMGEAI